MSENKLTKHEVAVATHILDETLQKIEYQDQTGQGYTLKLRHPLSADTAEYLLYGKSDTPDDSQSRNY